MPYVKAKEWKETKEKAEAYDEIQKESPPPVVEVEVPAEPSGLPSPEPRAEKLTFPEIQELFFSRQRKNRLHSLIHVWGPIRHFSEDTFPSYEDYAKWDPSMKMADNEILDLIYEHVRYRVGNDQRIFQNAHESGDWTEVEQNHFGGLKNEEFKVSYQIYKDIGGFILDNSKRLTDESHMRPGQFSHANIGEYKQAPEVLVKQIIEYLEAMGKHSTGYTPYVLEKSLYFQEIRED